MDNAQLIGLSRQISLRRQLDNTANNLANINTTGFKTQQMLFEEYLMPVAHVKSLPATERNLSYSHDYGTSTNFANGTLRNTGNPLDIALQGPGFLTVETVQGPQYTRAGNLLLDPDGTLITHSGNPVLVEGAALQIAQEDQPITIDRSGLVSSAQGELGRLTIVEFDDPQQLSQTGSNLFEGNNPIPAENTSVLQGSLESSNVESVTEMAKMIEITRMYASMSKLLNKQEELEQRAIRELGRLDA
ncbi:flagellar basal-body rod protein FlgF [Polycladidibacter stylochi]|uniref:flagellar basal-body rod protein FlgF n=1 Tax=Polycladidibacter stylochi TaxID=1807766 RepID=UPI00082B09B5|nr:flagellar basal-body rod protein FlgF [Pseudovibrio stylochi]